MNEKRDITGPRTGKQTGKIRNKEGSPWYGWMGSPSVDYVDLLGSIKSLHSGHK